MRIIIVGIGDIGLTVARDLTRHGSHEVILLDSDPSRCSKLSEGDLDVLVMEGDGTDPELLKKAQIEGADVLVACTGSDAINTVTAMLAKRLGVPTTIVKLKGLGLRPACREIGVTKIIAPTISAAADIIATASGFDRLDLSLISQGGLRVVDLPAGKGEGARVGDIEWPRSALVIALLRKEDVLLAHPDTLIEPGDVLLALVENEGGLKQLQEALV